MADFDRRARGGGRPFGGFNNRKRRYRDDDFDDRRPQRRRYEEPISLTLRKQVLAIAESPMRRVEEDIASIAKTVAENYFDSDLTTGFLNLVVQMTVEQPLKIPFIAAIVLLANIQKPEFTGEILKGVGTSLQKYLDMGAWREVKLYLRLLGCLQGLFEGDGIFTILEDLFSRAVDLQTESSEDSLGLELVKIILLTIPYTMSSSATGFTSQANALLDKTDVIASTPHALESLVDPYPNLDAPDVSSSESALALLQKLMQEEAKSGWELACLPRPWKEPRDTEGEDPLLKAQKHSFPEVVVPTKVVLGPNSIYPEVYFSVYGDQDLETVPPSSDSASLLIRDSLTDTINVLDFNRTVAARFLIDVDCYFAPNTFVKRATAFDKLREMAGDKSTWKPEDVVVDAAFASLFQLPSPQHKLVYYHSIITEACKIAPAAVAPSLGRAIRYLYRNIDRLDQELGHRFLDWFAHHLSNFGFTWKWSEWVEDVQLPDVNPKKAFILAAMDKEIRLSFAQRIKGTLPEPYQALISEAKEKDAPDFKFNDDSVPFAAQAREVAQLIRRKAADEEMGTALTEIESTAKEAGGANVNPILVSTDVFVTAICWVGSKSLSHVLNVIERCKNRLTSIPDGPGKKQIITSIIGYWQDHPGIGVNVVDKLLNYQILNPQTVVEWALVDHIDRGTALAKAWCFELICQTTEKVFARVKHVVTAMRRPGLPEDQVEILRQALGREMESLKLLFGVIEDACVGVQNGWQDGMMETSDALRQQEEGWVKSWGGRWRRCFARKSSVVQAWVEEELARPLPKLELPIESQQEAKADHDDAVVAVNGETEKMGD